MKRQGRTKCEHPLNTILKYSVKDRVIYSRSSRVVISWTPSRDSKRVMVNRRYVSVFLSVLVPLLLALTAILLLLLRSEFAIQEALMRNNEQHVVQLGSQWIHTELERLRGDVRFLVEQSSLKRWLSTEDPAALANLGDDLLAFARHRGLYDQVRFIDHAGNEKVRIDWNDGQPQRTATEALQNKSARYYVNETLGLQQGEIYQSPFDLNMENGVIEQPVKPVIRIATPVFDRQQRLRGVMVMNYLGSRLLDRLREIRGRGEMEIWLLNPDGHWLLGPNPGEEWGFMYPKRRDASFASDYPRLWEKIRSGDEAAQWEHEGGLITYQQLSRLTYLVGRMPE